MNDKKHKLIEVMCAFQLRPTDSSSSVWSNVFFGQYFEKIKPIGYSKKTEQKGSIARFNSKNKQLSIQESDELRIIFYHENGNYAIMMSKEYLSVHQINPYQSWSVFQEEIGKVLQLYQEVVQQQQITHCILAYINQWFFEEKESISSYFKLSPPQHQGSPFGKEVNLRFEKQYQVKSNYLLVGRLVTQPKIDSSDTEAVLECIGIATNESQSANWFDLTQLTHSRIEDFFRALV